MSFIVSASPTTDDELPLDVVFIVSRVSFLILSSFSSAGTAGGVLVASLIVFLWAPLGEAFLGDCVPFELEGVTFVTVIIQLV